MCPCGSIIELGSPQPAHVQKQDDKILNDFDLLIVSDLTYLEEGDVSWNALIPERIHPKSSR